MNFEPNVPEALFDRAERAWFALGDGTVAVESGDRAPAHGGAILAAALRPGGDGVGTGGDDGRLVWSRGGETQTLAELKGRWIDVVATSAASGLLAFATG